MVGLDVRLEHGDDRDALGSGGRDVLVDEIYVGIDDSELRLALATQQVGRAGGVVVEELAKEHGTKVRVCGRCTKGRLLMPGMPSRNGSGVRASGSLGRGAAGDTRAAAVAQRLDEGAFRGSWLAAVGPEQVHGAAHALRTFDPELDELTALELVRDHEA